jgi:hypothetical protein
METHKSLAGHPPPCVKDWGISAGRSCMRILITSLFTFCLFPGCRSMMVGDPVNTQDFSSENEAEENLKAIRKMLDDQGPRRVEERSGPSSKVAPSPSRSAPSAPSASDEAPLSAALSRAHPVPSPSSSAGIADVPAKLPWTPTAPRRPTIPDRQVPAYTIPAPVGPDYSGSIRCVPDGMGGQRCLGR